LLSLSSVDGSIIAGPISVSPNTPYGALVDKYGVLWGASLSNNLLRMDTNTKQPQIFTHGFGSDYGIALGYDDIGNTIIYQASSSGNSYIRFNSSSKTFSAPAALKFPCLGVATDSNGNIFCSNSGTGAVTKFAPDGSVIWTAAAQVNSEARGTVVDSNGDVWVIHRVANKLSKFNGSTGAPLGVVNSGKEPYTYSDATGLGLRSSVNPQGTWNVETDSGINETKWNNVSWSSKEPTGTSFNVQVRTSNDKNSWSAWQPVTNGVLLINPLEGRYLEVQTLLQSANAQVSPVLYDLTIGNKDDNGGNNGQIPEFPTVAIPIAAILGLVFVFGRKRE
jgi:uncharacterized glyoxalase superfamily protein PhnB